MKLGDTTIPTASCTAASPMDFEEDYCVEYSEEEDSNSSAGGDETGESSSSDGIAEELHYAAAIVPQKNYRILNEEDLRRLQENDISTVSDALCVSRGAACSLLCRNNWNPSAAYDDWFAADKPPKPSATPAKRKRETEVCTICFDETAVDLISAACGHRFCPNCWRRYISTSINDGPNCLTLSCPEPDCKTFVGLEMIDSLSSDDDRKKYHQFLHRSYVESNPARKWCPGPGCDFAVEFDGGEPYDVTCDCSFKFCWNCTEENHRPVDCETVAKWAEKNTSETDNTTWILAYTKPCPKCRISIEKTQGCCRMTCKCGFQFCWVCLREYWTEHLNYNCNKYREDQKNEKIRKKARENLERYNHFFERFVLNDNSRKRALLDSQRVGKVHVETLGRAYSNEPHGRLQRLVGDAWDQIVECRRVLKWSYAYGYYLSLSELQGKLRLFEHLQGQAESALERLHHCAEMEMAKFLNGDRPIRDFWDLLSRLAGLTSVSKTYFQNLVTALENNLSEVQE